MHNLFKSIINSHIIIIIIIIIIILQLSEAREQELDCKEDLLTWNTSINSS